MVRVSDWFPNMPVILSLNLRSYSGARLLGCIGGILLPRVSQTIVPGFDIHLSANEGDIARQDGISRIRCLMRLRVRWYPSSLRFSINDFIFLQSNHVFSSYVPFKMNLD